MDSKKEYISASVEDARARFKARVEKAKLDARTLTSSLPGISVVFPDDEQMSERMRAMEKRSAEAAAAHFDYLLDKAVDLVGKLKEHGVDTKTVRATVVARALGELGWFGYD